MSQKPHEKFELSSVSAHALRPDQLARSYDMAAKGLLSMIKRERPELQIDLDDILDRMTFVVAKLPWPEHDESDPSAPPATHMIRATLITKDLSISKTAEM